MLHLLTDQYKVQCSTCVVCNLIRLGVVDNLACSPDDHGAYLFSFKNLLTDHDCFQRSRESCIRKNKLVD